MLLRREFVRLFGAAASGAGGARAADAPGGKALRGIFPIGQTPFTESDRLDFESLANQVRFSRRAGVHGFVWPQLASEWAALTEKERLDGAEAIVAAARGTRLTIGIGVQAADVASAIRYAEHAARAGADAVVSLPPPGVADPEAILQYYKVIGSATGLPLCVQATGNMSVPFIVKMWKAIPTLRFVKDEAGEPLMRIRQLREETSGRVYAFTGGHGRTLIDEMTRGFSGTMPAVGFADLYASVWDLWWAGKKKEAIDVFGKASALISEVQVYGIESLKYILYLRGVFKTWRMRKTAAGATAPTPQMLAAGGLETKAELDAIGRQVLETMLEAVKPFLRG